MINQTRTLKAINKRRGFIHDWQFFSINLDEKVAPRDLPAQPSDARPCPDVCQLHLLCTLRVVSATLVKSAAISVIERRPFQDSPSENNTRVGSRRPDRGHTFTRMKPYTRQVMEFRMVFALLWSRTLSRENIQKLTPAEIQEPISKSGNARFYKHRYRAFQINSCYKMFLKKSNPPIT